MYKTMCIVLSMYAFTVLANECEVKNIDSLAEFARKKIENHYFVKEKKSLTDIVFSKTKYFESPEVEVSYTTLKDDKKNNELELEVLFNLDSLNKYSYKKKIAVAQRDLNKNALDRETNALTKELVMAIFHLGQDTFFNERISNLIKTIESSEIIYSRKIIKSREDEVILNSLGIFKASLKIKLSNYQNKIAESRIKIDQYSNLNCSLGHVAFTDLINNLNEELRVKNNDLAKNYLTNQLELNTANSLNEKISFLGNLKFGPRVSKSSENGVNDLRLGVVLNFDFPNFTSYESGYAQMYKIIESKDYEVKTNNINNRRSKLTALIKEQIRDIKTLPSDQKLESNLLKIKKYFDQGSVSALSYIESYRSYLDLMEESQESRELLLNNYLDFYGEFYE